MMFRVLHHNQCFDGACSAAVFTKFHRQCVGTASGYEFVGLQHAVGGGLSETMFGAGENAIVDFKYSQSPKLTWWFDHHQSAFPTAADRDHFEAGQRDGMADRQFFDPEYISCTSFIVDTVKRRFGFDAEGLDELLRWADIIDGARFTDATMAVEMKEPALKLAMVIENADTPELIPSIIPMLTTMQFAEIVEQRFVKERIAPLMERNDAALGMIRDRARVADGVITFDLLDRVTEGLSKFIPYYLHPEAVYTVAVSRSSFRTKISVGTNPWTKVPVEQLVNLAAVCERFGGGGHARVGAISFGADEIERTRAVAKGIAEELRAHSGN